ncbi:GRAM domain-containing protein [Dendrosporobacter sp. 1207_IL3150]|uniref:GRAM domain-containing protein n=1 Tax=Dendrosporobacter sp. 1207_IL3150 TaxID=3084054 RepID=UPI002FDA4C84
MYSFPLAESEQILNKDFANLYCDGDAFNGALYLTNERIVFVGYLLDINNKYIEEIPLVHIKEIKKDKTFFVIPNCLLVETIKERNLKFIISKRDKWYSKILEEINKL